jgi:two-component system, OmpR family, KDP operon response regulator KdpE
MKGLLRLPPNHRSILVADQDEGVRGLFVRSLEPEGFSVYEAEAGREVLVLARKRLFDILIMEVSLPDLDGVHTLRLIRETVGPVPCILIGEELTKEVWMNALAVEAYALLEAPFRGEVVRHTVLDLVHRHFGPDLW